MFKGVVSANLCILHLPLDTRVSAEYNVLARIINSAGFGERLPFCRIFWNHEVSGRTRAKSLERNELQAKSRYGET
jgi:hypothetical protein